MLCHLPEFPLLEEVRSELYKLCLVMKIHNEKFIFFKEYLYLMYAYKR